MKRPTILVTNDDGITAPGLRNLIRVMKPLGNLVVIAPDKGQSGMAHAITVNTPLRLYDHVKDDGYEEFSCNGTPVDCVKLAEKIIIRGKPDLIVSGINHGSNASINIIYSGTMAAVIEGITEGIPAVGFSLCDYDYHADFSACDKYVRMIAEQALAGGLPAGVGLNVNIPAADEPKIRGVRICRQAKAYWDEEFEERKDPRMRNYYWLTGVFKATDSGRDTDEWALSHNYVSVVPVYPDLTAYNAIPVLKKWKLG